MASHFYIKNQDEELFGPFTQSEIKHEINQGSIVLEDYISKSRQGPWILVKEAIIQLNHAKRANARKDVEVSHTNQIGSPQAHQTVTPTQADDNHPHLEKDTQPLFDPEGSNPRIFTETANQPSTTSIPLPTGPGLIDKNESPENVPLSQGGDGDIEQTTYVETVSKTAPLKKSSLVKQALNYLTFIMSMIALISIAGYYYTHDVLQFKQPEIVGKTTEEIHNNNLASLPAPGTTPVNLTANQANVLHDIIQKAFIGENLVSKVNEISGMKDEKKVTLSIDQLRYDLSRLKLWLDENNQTLEADTEVFNEFKRLVLSRELAINVAESLQFAGYIPWAMGDNKFSRQSNARAEKIIIVKVFQPKVDDNMKNIPWAEKLLANKPSEIPEPSQKGIFLFFNALDWAKYIDNQEEQILKRLKELL